MSLDFAPVRRARARGTWLLAGANFFLLMKREGAPARRRERKETPVAYSQVVFPLVFSQRKK